MAWSTTDKASDISVSSDEATASKTSGAWSSIRGSDSRDTGKYYYEIEFTSSASIDNGMIGFADANHALNTYIGEANSAPVSLGIWSKNGSVYSNGASYTSVSSADYNVGDRVGFAFDFDAGTVSVTVNGVEVITATFPAGPYFPAGSLQNDASMTLFVDDSNLQYRPSGFEPWYSAPTGSRVSGVVQIDGIPAERTVRAFSYGETLHNVDGANVTLSKSLGHATSDPQTGEYTIDLLGGYGNEIFVVAFDDYGQTFVPDRTLSVGDRVHPTTPNGHVWECTGSGTLPSEEPAWVVDTETAQLYGTASMIAKPFYRPMVHGPVKPEVAAVAGDPHWDKVILLLVAEADSYPSTTITDRSTAASTVASNTGLSIVDGSGFEAVQEAGAFYLSVNNKLIMDIPQLGAGDFTIEMYIRRNGTHPNWPIVWATTDDLAVSSGHLAGQITSDGDSVSYSGGSRIEDDDSALTTLTIPNQQFFHYALCREGGVLTVFINGVVSIVDSGKAVRDETSGKFVLGQGNGALIPLWFKSIRVTKGVARYNSNFAPPTEKFQETGPY